ncbi:N-acetylglucosamine kinase-like BadF-type ATPase [Microbacterium resistens]|uniref:N-acetylglucosamine kinase-like BadF-type ATPase n=1 Tax=Microbacterium resistens TaxID=156977 RepID=A0ABU1S9E1_9MICO|nr:BadF/BadG/BcrA/BcrD ATPase family protein [Microbacterium resistens]MDR6866232.1 N-acetylglucosamine kinase-like BadF-type ATPase [Microbacterium resistens]
MIDSATVAVDLGKSRCRLSVEAGDIRILRDGPGTPGLAAVGGVEQAVGAIMPLLRDALVVLAASDSGPAGLQSVRLRIGVGAAGALADAASSLRLAELLSAKLFSAETGAGARAETAVASDVVTAHAGALAGEAGTLLIAGTGAVAFGIDEHGARQADGWGPDLGDLGGGSWLGREAVRAVLRARDGLGPSTALTAALAALIGDGRTPITWLAGDEPLARRLATAAPLVLDLADTGDAASVAIRDEGASLLASTAAAASGTLAAVALHGGLLDHAGYRAAVSAALAGLGLDVRPSVGDALTGAAMIAEGRTPLHERFVHRAG